MKALLIIGASRFIYDGGGGQSVKPSAFVVSNDCAFANLC